MPDAGDNAPDFVLPSTDGDVRLSEVTATSKVLLAFYTEDFTPLCANEVSVFKDDFEIVESLGARVFAISADHLDSHREFADSLGGVPFPLVADEKLAAARAYDVVDDGVRLLGKPLDADNQHLLDEPKRDQRADGDREGDQPGFDFVSVESIGELEHPRSLRCVRGRSNPPSGR